MPFLDVDSPLVDPDFADVFNVNRRMETIDGHGRSVKGQQIIRNVVGVVTAISPNDLQRADGYQSMPRSISVVTKFFLRGEVIGEQPDIVIWRGSNFVVKHVDSYPHFGAGFMQAECTSMDHVDPAFGYAPPGKLNFNDPINAPLAQIISLR